jgi:predicted GNAT superfamily acetyltransferase
MDKPLTSALIITIATLFAFNWLWNHHDESMSRIASERHLREWELKLDIDQAKAEQARYRALELNLICQFVDNTGFVYTSKECEE